MNHNCWARRELLAALGAGLVMPRIYQVPTSQSELITRPIPSSGESLSVVGLGTWQQFDVALSNSERAELRDVLQLFVDNGGQVVDSSPMYGRAESVVGELASQIGIHDRLFYATKVWTSGRQAGIDQMEQSMRRMRTQRMDLMQIHNLVDWQVHLETLREWKASGRVRYIGITHYQARAFPQLEEIIRSESLDFVQANYSIGTPNAEQRLLPLAAEHGVAVLVNRPFDGGGLFQRVRGRDVPSWAREFDCQSWGQFFLKYILSAPEVTCAIPGTSNPRHVVDNMGAARGRLPEASERRRMARFMETV